MRVDTPVATMGIRGTAVLVEINANNGQTKFSVMVEPNGTVGSFNLYDKGTGTLIATVNNSTVGWVVTPTGPLQVIAQQVQKTQVELARELSIVQQVFQIFNQGQQNPFDPSQPPQQQQPTDPSNRGDNPNPQNTQTAQGTQFIPSNDGVITVTVTQPAGGGGSNNSQSSNNSSNSNSSSSGTGTSSTDTTTADTDSTSSVTYIFGTDGNDILTGTANDDLLYAFGGDDIIIAGHGGGDDYYEGGGGFDEIRFTSTELGVEFHLNVTTVNGVKVSTATGVTETGTDTFVGIEKIVGGSGDDVFVLYDDADWKIDGREGFDIIRLAGDLDLTQESSDLYASNIELLDLDQNLSNLVRFTVGDIRTADSEMNALRVHADAGDAIELSDRYEVDGQLIEGEWRQSTQAVIFEDGYSDGRTFRQWEFVSRANDVPVTLATLYVQDTAPVSVVDGGHVFDFPLGEANQYGRRLVRTEADDGDGYFTSQGFGHYYPDVSVSDRDYHLGEDWNESGQSAADLGDPVFAIGHGTVVFSGDGGSGWGNVVIIRHELADGEHGGFVTSLYGHLDALEVGVGDTVHRGQPIGTIGDHPGGPHLHLEIREGTNPDALIVGHGYSEQPRPAGWLDPSEFIASHQNAAGNRWTVSPQDAVVSEDDGFVTFTIARPLSDIAQTVFVSTVDTHGSANEQDYQYWYNVPVAFAPGESARDVTIRIVDDAMSENGETFGLIVQDSPDDPVSANLASATFTIVDDGEGMSAGTSDFVATFLDQESAANPWISALSNGMNWTTYNSETTIIAYYLADDETLPDPAFSGQEIGFNAWSAAERSAIFRVMETYEHVLNVKFVPAENMDDAQIIWGAADTSTWAVFDLYPTSKGVTIAIQDGQTIPDLERADADQLAIVINQGIYGEDFSGLNAGGFNYRTMLHELGHALGLAHPHPDEISDEVYFPGVFESEETPGVFGYGDMALNQGIYTVMSYNRGWNTGPDWR
ncbi:MAG: peptidoglycan DD-metalloendopeptidase family protein, partial [Pseudorhodoplanes sp.]|nr:peptidoglycan DD-metalloendopeptidase family protein [Pseudorhodoplanes sp.]